MGGFIFLSKPHLKANLKDRLLFSLLQERQESRGSGWEGAEEEREAAPGKGEEGAEGEAGEREEGAEGEGKEGEWDEEEIQSEWRQFGRGGRYERWAGVGEGGVYIPVYKPAWIHSTLQSCVGEHVQESV